MTAAILPFGKYEPEIDEGVFLASTATIIGRVRIERDANIWFGAVLRGDLGPIRIGERSVVEDNCVLHADTWLAEDVLIGHSAVVEQATVHAGALVGSGCTIFEGVEIGAGTMIAAGSVVRGPLVIPPGVLVAGAPAQIKKPLGGRAAWWVKNAAPAYGRLARAYQDGFTDEELAEMSEVPRGT